MTTAIIRSCDRDDLRALLCYQTMKKYKVADNYIFFHEKNRFTDDCNCPNISSAEDAIIVMREFCDNFGGENNIITMLKEIKEKFPAFEDNDKVIFCDADIIMRRNPFDFMPTESQYAGICNDDVRIGGIYRHFSGQFNILSGRLWNKYIEEGEKGYRERRIILDKYNYSIADDSVLSTFVWQNNIEPYNLFNDNCWLHYKISPDEYEKYLNA